METEAGRLLNIKQRIAFCSFYYFAKSAPDSLCCNELPCTHSKNPIHVTWRSAPYNSSYVAQTTRNFRRAPGADRGMQDVTYRGWTRSQDAGRNVVRLPVCRKGRAE